MFSIASTKFPFHILVNVTSSFNGFLDKLLLSVLAKAIRVGVILIKYSSNINFWKLFVGTHLLQLSGASGGSKCSISTQVLQLLNGSSGRSICYSLAVAWPFRLYFIYILTFFYATNLYWRIFRDGFAWWW